AADRASRHCVLPEFWLLENAATAVGRRSYAPDRKPACDLVRYAQHPFLHDQGLRAALRRDQRQDGARGRTRPLRPAAAAQCALVVLEHVWRARRVSAEPRRQAQMKPALLAGGMRPAAPAYRFEFQDRKSTRLNSSH